MSILKLNLPKKEKRDANKPKLALVQAQIPADLRATVKSLLKKEKYTIREFVQNCFEAYAEEKTKKRG